MNVGFYYFGRSARTDGPGPIGGGDVFVDGLMKALNAVPDVRAFYVAPGATEGADLVHVYGFGVDAAGAVLRFKESGVPVALMPNWRNDPDLDRIRLRTVSGKILHAARSSALLKWNTDRRRSKAFSIMARALEAADAAVAYARSELRHYEETFRVRLNAQKTLRPGVDPYFFQASPDAFRARFGAGDFALYAARIDDQKNHMNLLGAMRRARGEIRLVLAGQTPDTPRYRAALDRMKRLGGDRVHFAGQLSRTDLASAYKAARVYIQPSLFEIPGLASLEAAVAGCRLVMTERGCTKDVFGDWALYCDPLDPEDIKNKLEQAWDSPPREGQAEYFRDAFAWENAARDALAVYREILAGPASSRAKP